MKNLPLIIALIFLISNKLLAQTKCFETFLNEGYSEFVKGNYDASVKNYIYANNKCEDKPEQIDLKDSIDKAYECKIYIAAAEKEFNNRNYNIAIGFYKTIYTSNPKDTFALNQYIECNKRLSCFGDARSAGINKFAESDYENAKQSFVNAANCDYLPAFSDIKQLTDKTDSCIKYKSLAETSFRKQSYSQAIENYNRILNYNPNDYYCKQQIDIAEVNYFPKILLIDYSFHALCPYGISIGYVEKSGIILHSRFDFNKFDLHYSILSGYMRSFYKIKRNVFYFAACAGYGKYSDFWYQMGETAHHSTYQYGLQFEGNILLKTNVYNIGLGYSVPTFNLNYSSLTINAGININLKKH